MTNPGNNQEESGQFNSEFEEDFAEGFVEILDDLKKQSIAPVVRIFVEQIERYGYTLYEVLNALAGIVHGRNLRQATALLESAASEVDRGQERPPFEPNVEE